MSSMKLTVDAELERSKSCSCPGASRTAPPQGLSRLHSGGPLGGGQDAFELPAAAMALLNVSRSMAAITAAWRLNLSPRERRCRRLVGRALLRDPDGRDCRSRFHCTDACRPPTHTPDAPWRSDRRIRHPFCHATGPHGTVKIPIRRPPVLRARRHACAARRVGRCDDRVRGKIVRQGSFWLQHCLLRR